MHWMQRRKPQLIAKYRFWKKLEKMLKIFILEKKGNFGGFSWFYQKRYFSKSWGFLRYIQCIKTLLLSYQNQLSDNFHKGGPFWLRGGPIAMRSGRIRLKRFWKCFSWTLWHSHAYKCQAQTNFKGFNLGISLSFILTKECQHYYNCFKIEHPVSILIFRSQY